MITSNLRKMALDGGGMPGLLGMMKPSAPVAAAPVAPAPVAAPVAAPAPAAPTQSDPLSVLLDPNNLGMGQQLSAAEWAAIDKATGTNIGPAQDGSPYYEFTGLTDMNSTGWTPTQAFYDALNGYNASQLGSDNSSYYWNISGPNGAPSNTPTFTSSSKDSLGGLDKVALAAIGAMAGPAAFTAMGGGAGAGLGANMLAGAGTGAALGGTTSAVTSMGDWNAIGNGVLTGGLTGAAGGALYQGMSGIGDGMAVIDPNSVPSAADAGLTSLGQIDTSGLSNVSVPEIGSATYLNGMGSMPAALSTAATPPIDTSAFSNYASQTVPGVQLPTSSLSGVVPQVNAPSGLLSDPSPVSYSSSMPPELSTTPSTPLETSIPRVDVPQVQTLPPELSLNAGTNYSNEGAHYSTDAPSPLDAATQSPINSTPLAGSGLLDWMKANPGLAKTLVTGVGGLLGGFGSSSGGSISGTGAPVTPNLWNVGKAPANTYTAPTQYATPQVNMTGQQNSGAWRWMKG